MLHSPAAAAPPRDPGADEKTADTEEGGAEPEQQRGRRALELEPEPEPPKPWTRCGLLCCGCIAVAMILVFVYGDPEEDASDPQPNATISCGNYSCGNFSELAIDDIDAMGLRVPTYFQALALLYFRQSSPSKWPTDQRAYGYNEYYANTKWTRASIVSMCGWAGVSMQSDGSNFRRYVPLHTRVTLADNYADISDASGGPLEPGDFGEVIDTTGSRPVIKAFRRSLNRNTSWHYDWLAIVVVDPACGVDDKAAGVTGLRVSGLKFGEEAEISLGGDIHWLSYLSDLQWIDLGTCYHRNSDGENSDWMSDKCTSTEFYGRVEELGELRSLRSVDLTGAKVEGDVGALARLPHLTVLLLSKTGVGGSLSSFADSPLTNLETLVLDFTQVSGMVEDLGRAPKLGHIEFNDSNIVFTGCDTMKSSHTLGGITEILARQDTRSILAASAETIRTGCPTNTDWDAALRFVRLSRSEKVLQCANMTADAVALQRFRSSGPSWPSEGMDGWQPTCMDACAYEGATCDVNMRVTLINGRDYPEITGNVEFLSGLSELTSITLAGTQSFGSLEVLLSACSKLTHCDMESSRVTGRVESIARLMYLHSNTTDKDNVNLDDTLVSYGRSQKAGSCLEGSDMSRWQDAWDDVFPPEINKTKLPTSCSACEYKMRCPGVGKCSSGATGRFCTGCSESYFEAGPLCVPCATSKWISAAFLCLVGVAVTRLFWKMAYEPDEFAIKCVLSFGSRQGGFEFAKELKTTMMSHFGWERTDIYLDHDALQEMPDTVAETFVDDTGTPRTRYLNDNWDTYYRKAMADAPTMCFCLSKAWCESQWCREELVWFLVLKTLGPAALMEPNADGTGLRDIDPADVLAIVESMTVDQRRALWDGSFFITTDAFSAGSVTGDLVEELGCPIEQIWDENHISSMLASMQLFIAGDEATVKAQRRRDFVRGYTIAARQHRAGLDTQAVWGALSNVSTSVSAIVASITLPNIAFSFLPLQLPFSFPEIVEFMASFAQIFAFFDFGVIASPECFVKATSTASVKLMRLFIAHGAFWLAIGALYGHGYWASRQPREEEESPGATPRVQSPRDRATNAAVLVFILAYGMLIRSCLRLLGCSSSEENVHRLVSSPEVRCSEIFTVVLLSSVVVVSFIAKLIVDLLIEPEKRERGSSREDALNATQRDQGRVVLERISGVPGRAKQLDDYIVRFGADKTILGVPSVRILTGRVYFEVELTQHQNEGGDAGAKLSLDDEAVLRVGWATDGYIKSEDGRTTTRGGLGDTQTSWGVCGLKQSRYSTNLSTSLVRKCAVAIQETAHKWGDNWIPGDTIGCAADLDSGEMRFSRNGNWELPMGLAFEGVRPCTGLYPVIMGSKVVVRANCSSPWKYQPPGTHFEGVLRAAEATAAEGTVSEHNPRQSVSGQKRWHTGLGSAGPWCPLVLSRIVLKVACCTLALPIVLSELGFAIFGGASLVFTSLLHEPAEIADVTKVWFGGMGFVFVFAHLVSAAAISESSKISMRAAAKVVAFATLLWLSCGLGKAFIRTDTLQPRMAWFWGVQYGEELWLSVLGFVGSILYMAVLPAVLYRQLHRCYAVNSLYAGPGHHRFGFLFLRFEPGQWGYEFRIFGRKAGLLVITGLLGTQPVYAFPLQYFILFSSLNATTSRRPFVEVGLGAAPTTSMEAPPPRREQEDPTHGRRLRCRSLEYVFGVLSATALACVLSLDVVDIIVHITGEVASDRTVWVMATSTDRASWRDLPQDRIARRRISCFVLVYCTMIVQPCLRHGPVLWAHRRRMWRNLVNFVVATKRGTTPINPVPEGTNQWSRPDMLEALGLCGQLGNVTVALVCAATGADRPMIVDVAVTIVTLLCVLVPSSYGARIIASEWKLARARRHLVEAAATTQLGRMSTNHAPGLEALQDNVGAGSAHNESLRLSGSKAGSVRNDLGALVRMAPLPPANFAEVHKTEPGGEDGTLDTHESTANPLSDAANVVVHDV